MFNMKKYTKFSVNKLNLGKIRLLNLKVKIMIKILSIAGSDCSGGAGIQADIKTITAHKMYAMSVITALTAQNTTGVFGVFETPSEFVEAQIKACFDDIVPNAVKIGMVSNSQIIKSIAKMLKFYNAKNVVVDPVMVATSGGVLMKNDAVNSLIDELFALATIVTPNLSEAEVLSEMKIKNIDDMKKSAQKIAKLTNGAVLVKGGHLGEEAVDILYENGEFSEFRAPKIDTKNSHGTGCTLSSAIACGLGANLSLKEAVKNAKEFVFNALSWSEQIGHGNGAINHYFRIEKRF